MKRKYWIVIMVLVALVVSATVGWAANVYWRNGRYQLPGSYQSRVLSTILTDHKNQIDGLTAGGGAMIAAASVDGTGTSSINRYMTNLPNAPVVTVTRAAGYPVGTYDIDFGANVSGRYYNAVVGNGSSSGVVSEGYCTVKPKVGNSNALYVRVFTSAGNRLDTEFYVEIW